MSEGVVCLPKSLPFSGTIRVSSHFKVTAVLTCLIASSATSPWLAWDLSVAWLPQGGHQGNLRTLQMGTEMARPPSISQASPGTLDS